MGVLLPPVSRLADSSTSRNGLRLSVVYPAVCKLLGERKGRILRLDSITLFGGHARAACAEKDAGALCTRGGPESQSVESGGRPGGVLSRHSEGFLEVGQGVSGGWFGVEARCADRGGSPRAVRRSRRCTQRVL